MGSTTRWVGWLEVGWAASAFVAAPMLGAWSDRVGRRPVILVSMLGVALELIVDAVSTSVWWLLAGRVLCGLTYAGQAAAMAYVAEGRSYGRPSDIADVRARATP